MALVEVEIASSDWTDILERAASGEDILLMENGVARARLTGIPQPPGGERRLGQLAGRFGVPDDVDDPLQDDILALFEGR